MSKSNNKRKQISLNAFEMNCVAHLSPGLWRYPGDKALRYKDIEYWQEVAQIAEKGLFDAIFIADVLGVYDVYGGNDLGALKTALQVPVNDPMQLAIIGAGVTKHIGFGVTAGVPFEHPFPFARRLSTLDHLTKGRIGWNIVTGYLPSANKNMGGSELPHDERYELADEYMEVIYKLLEGSWEEDAVVLDSKNGVFADPNKIHHIGHHGKYFDVPGIHICEPSIQRTPVLFQAGNSARGRKFAATHAEAIFIAPPTKEYAKDLTVGSAAGALSGVVFGALAGGDIGRGAALGTAVGAGGGLVKSVWDKGVDVEIPANSMIDIVLTQPITVNPAIYNSNY